MSAVAHHRDSITRRTAVGGALACVLALLVAEGEALARRGKQAADKLLRVESGKRGVTLTFALANAPFPKGAKQYRDPTVIVFVPHHFRLQKSRKVDVVLHFHGHNNTARSAMLTHQLREQLADSKQNAILVVPQGPVNAADSSGGRLELRHGLRKLLRELTRELRRARVGKHLRKASLAGVRAVGMLCISAHSGGYRVTAACLRRGGVNVNEVYLFDALYGQLAAFRSWVVARKGKRGRERHKLISHYAGGKVRDNNMKLMTRLKRAGIKCRHEHGSTRLTRAQLTKGTALFLASKQKHGKVTHSHNNLRDCLYASGLRRYVDSKWFDGKNKARKIDRR